jgi:RNA polymerase sigma-70 factor (ECF subfamily)
MVYRWCRQAGLTSEDAEDIGQEVFIAVHRKVGDFRHDTRRGRFRGWLHVIACNKMRDLARRQRDQVAREVGNIPQRALLEVVDTESESDTPADPAEAALLARRALELLREEFSDEKWQIFQRVVVEGHTAADVATDMGISTNQVYLTKSRWLRRLRDEFAGLLDVADG